MFISKPIMMIFPLLFSFLFFVGLIAILIFLIRVASSPRAKQHRQTDASETKMMQEMHNGFSRMEERVEALETILMDQIRKQKERETTSEWR